jgi:hypothetical protein
MGKLAAAGKSEATETASDIEQGLGAAQGQPLHQVRCDLPSVVIERSKQPRGLLSIGEKRLDGFRPLPSAQKIREPSPKIPAIMVGKKKRSLAGAKMTQSERRILIARCPLTE